MKVFITGILGQIGSHLAECLLEKNIHVLGIDNLSTGKKYHLDEHKKLKIKIGSIENPKLVDSLMDDFKPDIIVHTAASYKDPNDWQSDVSTNCLGSVNLIKKSLDLKVSRFIYFQTALCYGLKPLENPITLKHPKLPANSSYAISKTAAEDYLELSGLDYVSFRLANVIGPRNLAGALPTFFKRISENKKCFVSKAKRDFVDVNDLVDVVEKAVDGQGHGAYHFSSGKDYEIKYLYDLVIQELKINHYIEPEIREVNKDEAPSILLDASKTLKDYGSEIIKTELRETVRKAIIYYKKFGVERSHTHLKQN